MRGEGRQTRRRTPLLLSWRSRSFKLSCRDGALLTGEFSMKALKAAFLAVAVIAAPVPLSAGDTISGTPLQKVLTNQNF